MDHLYTAEALSTGGGRDGRATVPAAGLQLVMAPPQVLGGSGDGVNPEQLFAAGYAACFHSALHAAARGRKLTLTDSSVGGQVHLDRGGEAGLVMSVDLEVVLPGLDHDVAQQLASEAHRLCPYSNATRGNLEVRITVSDD